MMKSLFPKLFTLLLFASSLLAESAREASNEVATEFETDAVLTSAEVKSILVLAARVGIPRPRKVQTFHYIPVLVRGIWVFGPEEINGRFVTYKMLEICREGWSSASVPKNVVTEGIFWIPKGGGAVSRYFVGAGTGDTQFRIEIDDGIEISVIDKIVDAFLRGKATYSDDLADGSQSSRLTRPTSIRRTATRGRYSVYCEEWSKEYEVEIRGNTVVILSESTIVV